MERAGGWRPPAPPREYFYREEERLPEVGAVLPFGGGRWLGV
jgi:hypothetical protein